MTPERALAAGAALPLVDAALRGALVATLVVLGAGLFRIRRSHVAARVGIAFSAGLAVQAFASLPLVERGWPTAWQAPLVAISVGNAVLFWLFARSLFDDGFAVGPREALTWLAAASIGAAFCLALAFGGPEAAATRALRFALRWVPAVFALLVIGTAAAQWRADLVERRRRLRAFIVGAGVAYALAMVAVRLVSVGGLPSPRAATFDTAALLVIVLGAALGMLRVVDAGGLLPERAAAPAVAADEPRAAAAQALPSAPDARDGSDAPDAFDARLAADLERLMSVERAYRIDDLTLGVLALKLGRPEYRVRRFIHQRLGHRNFNAYVNGLRLAEVRAALADPARREVGVLELALEAGFASAGPFNRAFKADAGLTPTEFRRRALGEG